MNLDMMQSEMPVPHKTGLLKCRSYLLLSFVDPLSTLLGSCPRVGTDWERQGKRIWADL